MNLWAQDFNSEESLPSRDLRLYISHPSWTVPALVGTRLYVRDRKNVMAVDLAAR